MVFGLKGEQPKLFQQQYSGTEAIHNMACSENNEVMLDKGDGMMDAGELTKCKNAVCFIFCNKEDTEK